MKEPILVQEWDGDEFHRRVIELESAGYVARQESYRIQAEMNPETGVLAHLYTIEMVSAVSENGN
jgi:hypothetical protein